MRACLWPSLAVGTISIGAPGANMAADKESSFVLGVAHKTSGRPQCEWEVSLCPSQTSLFYGPSPARAKSGVSLDVVVDTVMAYGVLEMDHHIL